MLSNATPEGLLGAYCAIAVMTGFFLSALILSSDDPSDRRDLVGWITAAIASLFWIVVFPISFFVWLLKPRKR